MATEMYRAVWAYTANDPDQISFRKGQLIKLIGKDASGLKYSYMKETNHKPGFFGQPLTFVILWLVGWWLGTVKNKDGSVKEGLFPANL